MRLIEDAEKKELLVDLLARIQEFLKANNICWFVGGGTMLGAVRHKGFIPWDDDIDILIPRADFIRLIHLIEANGKKFAESNMAIVEFDEHKKSYHKKFKISDTRTEMIEYGRPRPAVFVDVFPIDNFKTKKSITKNRKKILALDNMLALVHSGYVSSSGAKSVVYNILLFIFKIFGLSAVEKKLENRLLKLTAFFENGYTGGSEGAYGMREFSKSLCYKNAITLPFENIAVPVPAGYDEILTNLYGDYMTPPPPEEYHNHSYYKMYWKD